MESICKVGNGVRVALRKGRVYNKDTLYLKGAMKKLTAYDFTVKDNAHQDVALSQYKGKVLLILNTATQCGLTPQYEKLEELYKKYHGQGFEILDFPSNQFLEQAPGTDAEIDSFCTLNYGTTFPRFAKIDVNGPNADPLFQWLKEQAPADKGDADSAAFEEKVKALKAPEKPEDIKWNFGKFLIDQEGNVVGRFSPAYRPEQLNGEIEKLLQENGER